MVVSTSKNLQILPTMPMEFLERLPVPNLRVYTAISFTILSCSIYYATQIIKDPAWRTNHTHVGVVAHHGDDNIDPTDPRSLGTHLKELWECMVGEPVCAWVCSNLFQKKRLFSTLKSANLHSSINLILIRKSIIFPHISPFRCHIHGVFRIFPFFSLVSCCHP